ncbi:MAG TPA: replication-associated recombination protein A [Armatimonadota bacterium]|nr:replication-associated recombination protein A [Armatimonadota bacterium]
MNLFDEPQQKLPEISPSAPLAARMRPRTLDEYVGQQEALGEGMPLRRAIENDELTSLILWGPPGCGKTTLAHLIAGQTSAYFVPFSAVTSGVPELRKIILAARERRKMYGQRTMLFVDEIHRFNKAQQDAFLPVVEDGTITLIGATTENPYFEINAPLISRSRLVVLKPLSSENLSLILDRTLADNERGVGTFELTLTDEARKHLIDFSDGDARMVLNALEEAAKLAGKRGTITLKISEQAMQQRALRYDKHGDQHYDIVSAFIKSMRGSDPDAALYWMARMIEAGEDPRFIARRIVVHASEDVGNADPLALLVATAAANAVEFVGLPEARINLAQAVTYIACAPKSNAAVMAIDSALADVRKGKLAPVPQHLRDTSYPGAKKLGNGEGYQYPHNYPGHHVQQEYLPDGTKSQRYYQPTDQGYEKKIRERLKYWEHSSEDSAGESANKSPNQE